MEGMHRCVGVATLALLGLSSPATHAAGNATASRFGAADLLALREIGGYAGNLSLSSDGRYVAYQIQQADLAARTYKTEWFVAPVDSHASPVAVGSGGELMLNPSPLGRINGSRAEVKAEWSPDGRWIAYLRKDAGAVQLWRSRADGTRQEQVTHGAADVLSYEWRPDGQAIYVQIGRDREHMRKADQEEGDRGYLLDDRFVPDDDTRPKWFACGEDAWSVPQPASQACVPTTWIVEPGGQERKANEQEVREYRVLTEPERPAGADQHRKIQSTTWSRNRERAAWFENEKPDQNPGFAAPLTLFADGARCGAPECHGQLKAVWWDGDEVVFERKEGHAYGLNALYGWRPGIGSVRLIHRLDGVLESCEVAGGHAICLHETPTTPRKIVAIRTSDGTVETVFDPNPEFARFELGAVEKLEWKDAFGNETFGHLIYPQDYQRGKRYPLVIVQYRSKGFLKGGVGEEYPIYPLAAAGFVVLSFDRPNDWGMLTRYKQDEIGKSEAMEWKDAYERRRALTALEIILDELDRRGIVAPAKVGITGLSDGAETVDFALFNSDRFAAAANSGDWSPISYYLSAGRWTRDFMKDTLQASSGEEAVEKWKRMSIAFNADKVNTPLLIQVSDSELVMGMPNYVALKEAGKPVEAYVFPDEYHIKWQPQHKLAVYRRTIQWFRFWLMGIEDPDPVDPGQYERWRAMRVQQVALRKP